MTENRPYQPAKSPEEALAELRENAGGQFDPDVVAAFMRVHVQHHWEERARRPEPQGALRSRRPVLDT